MLEEKLQTLEESIGLLAFNLEVLNNTLMLFIEAKRQDPQTEITTPPPSSATEVEESEEKVDVESTTEKEEIEQSREEIDSELLALCLKLVRKDPIYKNKIKKIIKSHGARVIGGVPDSSIQKLKTDLEKLSS